jgi:tripeptide aminopeptidase
MSVEKYFLDFISYDTQSDPYQTSLPSTDKQFILGNHLVEVMKKIGIKDARIDDHCYVYGTIPANTKKASDTIGLIAHMDTSPSLSGKNVHPRIIRNYDGKDIALNKKYILSPNDFPNLSKYIGKDLIVTDGTTLLGGDDKAGIAEILDSAEDLIMHNIPHCTIKIAFTPDEEIGAGPSKFDVSGFNADYAFTVDGGSLGEIEYENFNAASVIVNFKGKGVHPGSAKNKMINSASVAIEFDSMLPSYETPEHTEGYEGFHHLVSINGDVENTRSEYIIRDHDLNKLEDKKKQFRAIASFLNSKYNSGTVRLQIHDQYKNMREKILPHFEIIEKAKKAMTDNDVEPIVLPIRGGTDGATLSYMGLPCPNICTGGENAHGRYEFVVINDMEKIKNILMSVVKV